MSISQSDNILRLADGAAVTRRLRQSLKGRVATELKGLSGSAFSLYASAALRSEGGVHIFVSEDKDAAAYLLNDFYSLLGEGGVLFFPTGYKRSIQFGQEDASGIVQRTAALNAIRNHREGYLVICTYPEALAEKVIDVSELNRQTIGVKVGDRFPMSDFEDILAESGFTRVDFVYEPGQYSMRGGIMDVFSYAGNRPYRFDFFGDGIDSIREFDIASQLSAQKLDSVEIVPNLKRTVSQGRGVSFASFAGKVSYWFDNPEYALGKIDDIRRKMLADAEDPEFVDGRVSSRKQMAEAMAGCGIIIRGAAVREFEVREVIEFHTAPQPVFNKQYRLLAENIERNGVEGYTTYLLYENIVQIERLENIFSAEGYRKVRFEPLKVTLHEGFVDHALRACFYTEHQVFERYHRYSLRGEIDRKESLTVSELNEMKPGDYVVHIDHGVGRFGGLVRTVENGKNHEAVKIEYKDGDVLLVNVHSLHRISRYKDKDSDQPPRIYKLGSGAWQRMKAATKSAVKDIARELIALYANRKASGGFAFSPDGYLQSEMEASFPYEETPDQQQTADLVKLDMESSQPMDRLICGDVGFGKTEVAIRAAFKAVNDSRQVAVLVPTTILALQHFRTFSQRLKGFPVRIESLSRARSAKETRQIEKDLEDGKIDILIGTHKILGKGVKFKSLGLLIIDEEQKFGVSAKEKLRQLSISVDTLTLTATPIPRTLQFSLLGARDLSVIATPPPNRQPISTESHLFDMDIIREAVEFELSRHGQVYFVHNRVGDIENIAAMVREICPKARVAVGHGQMPAAKTEKVIMDFIYGEFDVLVATSIIENGVDIPNANTIIINNAQNFGLSDLHQLRGRVGRSDRKSFCYLLTPPDELLSPDSRRRLRAIEEFSDLGSGFNIAMQDLDIRGAGNLLGAQQSGFIADMGFETYQKILNEAVTELRAEGAVDVESLAGEQSEAKTQTDIAYLTDAHIEIDTEALLPDGYIGQSGEKLRLYRELDNIKDEKELEKFAARLRDRFGELPEQAVALMSVVRLRWRCVSLGFEWAKVKNGLMLLRFVGDDRSPYFKSAVFMNILRYITRRSEKFVLKQNNNKVSVTVRNVESIGEACHVLDQLAEAAKAKGEVKD